MNKNTRRIISIVLLVSAIPFWLWLGIKTTLIFDALQLYAPVGALWVALAMIILQIFVATWIWPAHPQFGERRGDNKQRVRWHTPVTGGYNIEQGVVIRQYMDKHRGPNSISELHRNPYEQRWSHS
jgi:hypothetical protein